MIKTVETAPEIIYDEVYVTTPSMITRKGELDKLRDNTYISIIMGETPVDGFDTFVAVSYTHLPESPFRAGHDG